MPARTVRNRVIDGDIKLTDQQRAFCLELMANPECSATLAAEKAGYKNPSQSAVRLMKNKDIKAFLSRRQARREKRLEVTGDDVLREIMDIAFRDVADFVDEKGVVLENIRDIPDVARKSINSIEQKRHFTTTPDGRTIETLETKLHLVKKEFALEALVKHYGLNAPIKVEGEVSHKHAIDWEDYYRHRGDVADAVEQEIAKVAGPAPTNKVVDVPPGDYSVDELVQQAMGEADDNG
jgi:phage terminase small subunit